MVTFKFLYQYTDVASLTNKGLSAGYDRIFRETGKLSEKSMVIENAVVSGIDRTFMLVCYAFEHIADLCYPLCQFRHPPCPTCDILYTDRLRTVS